MKEYEVMVEVKICRTVSIDAPDAETAQVMAQQALESLYGRLGKDYCDYSTDELIIDVGDAVEAEQ